MKGSVIECVYVYTFPSMCEMSGTLGIWVRPTSGIPGIHISSPRVYTANASDCVCVSVGGRHVPRNQRIIREEIKCCTCAENNGGDI